MVTRTPLIVKLYVHCLHCYISFQCRQHHAVNSPLFIDWNSLVLEQQTIKSFCTNRRRILLNRLLSCAAGHSDTFLHKPAYPSLDVHGASVKQQTEYIQCLVYTIFEQFTVISPTVQIIHLKNLTQRLANLHRKFTASVANA